MKLKKASVRKSPTQKKIMLIPSFIISNQFIIALNAQLITVIWGLNYYAVNNSESVRLLKKWFHRLIESAYFPYWNVTDWRNGSTLCDINQNSQNIEFILCCRYELCVTERVLKVEVKMIQPSHGNNKQTNPNDVLAN